MACVLLPSQCLRSRRAHRVTSNISLALLLFMIVLVLHTPVETSAATVAADKHGVSMMEFKSNSTGAAERRSPQILDWKSLDGDDLIGKNAIALHRSLEPSTAVHSSARVREKPFLSSSHSSPLLKAATNKGKEGVERASKSEDRFIDASVQVDGLELHMADGSVVLPFVGNVPFQDDGVPGTLAVAVPTFVVLSLCTALLL